MADKLGSAGRPFMGLEAVPSQGDVTTQVCVQVRSCAGVSTILLWGVHFAELGRVASQGAAIVGREARLEIERLRRSGAGGTGGTGGLLSLPYPFAGYVPLAGEAHEGVSPNAHVLILCKRPDVL